MPTKSLSKWIGWVLLLSALAYSLLWVVCGAGNPMDPFYWLTKYELLESGFMACGTIAIGHAWIALFGRTICSMRVLGWLCTTAAVALPYCLLLDREQRRRNIHWLGLTYWLVGYGSFQEFSPGTISVLLLSLTVVMLFDKAAYRGRWLVWGLLLAALVLVRFPNILVLPILLLYCCWPMLRGERPWTDLLRDRRRELLLGIGCGALLYGLGLVGWYYGMHHAVAAPMARHTVLRMLQDMWKNGFRLVADISLWAAFAYVLSQTGREMREVWRWLIAIAAGGAMLYYVFYAFAANQWYNMDQIYLISSLVLLVAIVLYAQRERHTLPMSAVVFPLLIMSVASLGTDMGLMKLFPALLCLLPWWAAYVYWACRQRYVLLAMAVITPLFVVRFSTNAIGRHDIFRENTWGQTDVMRFTRISDLDNEQMEQIVSDYETYSALAPVYAVGDKLHMVRALTHCHAPVKNEFWSNIFDPVYTKWYSELVGREHPVIFCTFSPSFKTKPEYKDKHSRLEQMLLDSGYTAIDRSEYKYMIYEKK